MSDKETSQRWYNCELRLLRELCNKLKLNTELMQEMVFELNDMLDIVEKDCSVIEMVVLQAKRERSLKKFLDEYNKKYGTCRDESDRPSCDDTDEVD
jgi:hypothetical protein